MLNDILNLLCCPDDNSKLFIRDTFLECSKCKRIYNIIADNFLEILPSVFPTWNLLADEPKEAEETYLQEFRMAFLWERDSGGWGDLYHASAGTVAFYKAHMEKLVSLLNPKTDAIGIDVSGAVGNYAIFLADKLKTVINVDLHTPSLITAWKRRKNNMIILRSPYLKLPFIPNSFDYVVCTDTLERGWNHEVNLLKEIYRILKVGGKAFVDFHNLKRFRKKNRAICEYREESVHRLLTESGITQYSIQPFGYVPLKLIPAKFLYKPMNILFKIMRFPSQRHIVVFTKA